MDKIDEIVEYFKHSKQIDLLAYYKDIASSHKQKLFLIGASLITLAQVFLLVPIQYWEEVLTNKDGFLYFLFFSLLMVSFLVIAFIHQLSNFLTASTNRILTEANYLLHYYEESNKKLVKLDHKLRDGHSHTAEMAKAAFITIFVAFCIFGFRGYVVLNQAFTSETPTFYMVQGGTILIALSLIGLLVRWGYKQLWPRAKYFSYAQILLLKVRSEPNPDASIDAILNELELDSDLNKEAYSLVTKNV
jgi:hypothetical protein